MLVISCLQTSHTCYACVHVHTHTHVNNLLTFVMQDLRKSVGQIQSTLVKKLSILDKYEHVLAQVNAVTMERFADPKGQINILDMSSDPVVVAQQLTHIELVRESRESREREREQREREREREPLHWQ